MVLTERTADKTKALQIRGAFYGWTITAQPMAAPTRLRCAVEESLTLRSGQMVPSPTSVMAPGPTVMMASSSAPSIMMAPRTVVMTPPTVVAVNLNDIAIGFDDADALLWNRHGGSGERREQRN